VGRGERAGQKGKRWERGGGRAWREREEGGKSRKRVERGGIRWGDREEGGERGRGRGEPDTVKTMGRRNKGNRELAESKKKHGENEEGRARKGRK
jgi:hypothetical protein